jgi:hypothetical protein
MFPTIIAEKNETHIKIQFLVRVKAFEVFENIDFYASFYWLFNDVFSVDII